MSISSPLSFFFSYSYFCFVFNHFFNHFFFNHFFFFSRYAEITRAVIAGDLGSLSEATSAHESYFVDLGVLLVLEKLRSIALRNLLRKVYLIENESRPAEGKSNKLQLSVVQDALRLATKTKQQRNQGKHHGKNHGKNPSDSHAAVHGAHGDANDGQENGIHNIEIDIDEVECLVANLIAAGYVKGYISHSHKILVLSKDNPFPALRSVKSYL